MSVFCAMVLTSACVSTDALAQEPRRAPVRVITATDAPVKQVLDLSRSVTAYQAAALSPATAGLVDGILVDAGDVVAPGDVLLTLDDEIAQFQVAGDEAARRRAEQAVADARRRLGEAMELREKQTIAETAVLDLQTEVIEDEALLSEATAAAGRSRATLERHQLVAPFAGVISSRSANLGEWVTPGSTVFSLVSLDQLYVDLQVSEVHLGAIRPGMPMTLRLSGAEGQDIAATVAATVPVTDPSARTFLVRARADAPTARLLPGVSATARLALDTGRTRITVPRDAVLRYSDGRSVAWVIETVDGIDRARERRIETGLSFEGQIEVIAGVVAGERVVVAGNESLRNDQAVRIVDNR